MSSSARYFPATLGKGTKLSPATADAKASSPEALGAENPGQQSLARIDAKVASDIAAQLAAPSDETLIAQIGEGSREAMEIIFHRHASTVRRVVYRILRNAPETDDLVQEIFLLIHRECRAFDASKSPARFWILQIAYRRAISRKRYLTSRHFYSRIDLDEAAEDSNVISNDLDELIEQSLENNRLNKVFAALSDDQQKTLRLFFIEGYTFEEIAGKLGQSRGNVKHHYFRGLEKLRKELFGGKLPGERSV